MGVSAMGAFVSLVSSLNQSSQASRARRAGEYQATLQREALAELAAEREPVIPGPDDEAIRRARRRSIASQMRRRGRQSTILTEDSSGDVLGV